MLALTRKPGQSIVIGDQVEIIVVEVRGDQVRLGIKAPKDVSIYRKEIYDEILIANKAAANPAIPAQEIGELIARAANREKK